MGSGRLNQRHLPPPPTPVIPAKAGIQPAVKKWIPGLRFAPPGMTEKNKTTHKTIKTGPRQAGLLR
jgi:hypothetical protein